MAQDTISEHALDLDSEPPPRREPTGRHRAAEELEAAVERAVKRQAPSQAKAIAAIVLASLGAGGGFYGVSSYEAGRREARITEQLAAADRRIVGLERQVEGIGGLSRDMAALTAKVDGIVSTNAAANTAIQQRLDRIEDRLLRLEPGRRYDR